MEPQPALVRAQRRVVLHAVTAIDADGAVIVDPGHPEDDLTLRLAQPHQDPGVVVLGMMSLDHFERLEEIGRASCRERGKMSERAASFEINPKLKKHQI